MFRTFAPFDSLNGNTPGWEPRQIPLSLARRAAEQSYIQQPLILIPGPINRMPPEIISKVFVEAAFSELIPMLDGTPTSSTYFPMVLCHVSSYWRQIAFSTPQLWDHLSTRVILYGSPHDILPRTFDLDKLLVRRRTIEFLTWWAANIRETNTFSLRIELTWRNGSQFEEARYGTEIMLGKTGLSTILNLICRARYLHMQNYCRALPYLRHPEAYPNSGTLVHAMSFPSLESLVFQGRDISDVDFQRIPFHLMPALRKLRIGSPELSNPLALRISRPNSDIRANLKNMWGRLTHLHLRIRTSLAIWKAFIGTCISLESARIVLILSTPVDDDILSNTGGPMRTLPNLRELFLNVFDQYEEYTKAALFQGLHFPGLKTLVLATRVLSRGLLHLLLQATPSLERLHIDSRFPAVLANGGELIWESGDRSGGHLDDYVPHLKQLLIDMPPSNEYKGPLTEYARSLVRSGWLKGPWKNGPLHVELLWLLNFDNRPLEIQQLRRFLNKIHSGDADISVREINISPFLLDVDFVVPLWDAWFDTDATFGQSAGETMFEDNYPLFSFGRASFIF